MVNGGLPEETVGSVLLLPNMRVDVFKTMRLATRSNRLFGRTLKNACVLKVQCLKNEKYEKIFRNQNRKNRTDRFSAPKCPFRRAEKGFKK